MDEGRVTLYIAVSVDGYVATADGGVEWLDAYEQASADDETGYEAFFESVDCLVVGATTYEQVLTFGEWPYGDRPTYVFTHRDLPVASDAVEFVAGDVARVATRLGRDHGHVWLVGGAELARAFLRAGSVDELRLSVVPELLGDGIPLFGLHGGRRSLRLLDTRAFDTGIVELRYSIES